MHDFGVVRHSEVTRELAARRGRSLGPFADDAGLLIVTDTGLYLADKDWRVPDLVVVSDAHQSRRGVMPGAELVFEIRSPGDETFEKIDF